MPGAQSSLSFKDYDSLVDTVARWLARDDLAADIPDFIWLAECELQREVRFRLQDTTTTGTTVADQEYIEFPTDYVGGGLFRFDKDELPPIRVTSWSAVEAFKKNATGDTRVGVVHGTRLYVGPVPGAVAYTLFYKAGASHLSQSNPSNTILVEYPDALLYGALKHSAPFLGADERVALWNQLFTDAMRSAAQQEQRARTGHGPLHMRPDVGVR